VKRGNGGVVTEHLIRFALVQFRQILLGFVYLWYWDINDC
jgi:hypothetical protein